MHLRSLDRRLRRLEASVPPQTPQLSCRWELLTIDELSRFHDRLEAGTLTNGEFEHAIALAKEREAAGWTTQDVQRLSDAQKGVRIEFWQVNVALAERHGRRPSDPGLDVTGLSLEDVAILVQIAKTATGVDEIGRAAATIEKLRLNGRPITIDEFARLVLTGELLSTRTELDP